jgi:HSP20 family protein
MAEEGKEMVRSELRPAMSFRDFDKWFEDVLPKALTPFNFSMLRMGDEEMLMPHVDIFESNGDVVLKADLPGMNKDDIEVTLMDGSIRISGEKKKESEVKRKDYYKVERSYGSFCRTFGLPAEVKADAVKSTFKDGVLEVIMPKSEEAKSKEVKVKIG